MGYIVKAEHINNFINIRPIFEILDDGLIDICEEDFSPHGTIQIVKGYQYDTSELLEDNTYSILNLSSDDLSGCEQKDDGTIKLYIHEFIKNACQLDYNDKLVIREIFNINLELKEFGSITELPRFLNSEPITKIIYFKNNDYVVGPFSWKKDNTMYQFETTYLTGEQNFLVDVYSISELQRNPNIFTFDENNYYSNKERHLLSGNQDSLPNPIQQIDCIDDGNLKRIIGKELSTLNKFNTKQEKIEIKDLIINLSNENFTDERKDKMKNLLLNKEYFSECINDIIPSILASDDNIKILIESIFNNENYKNDTRFISYIKTTSEYTVIIDDLIKKHKELSEEINILKNEEENLHSEINNLTNRNNDKIISSNELLQKEKQILQDKITKLENKLSQYKEVDNLNQEITKLKAQSDLRSEDLKKTENDIKSLEGNFEKNINNAYKELFDRNFNGELANILMKKSSDIQYNKKQEEFKHMWEKSYESVKIAEISNTNDLINFLYYELNNKANRNVQLNDIVNVLICLSQGFLTILAGEPGTGKTSLVNLIAKILGLTNTNFKRYVEVPVEKGWTSKRDFIGYYNPLNKDFESSNKNMVNALQTLNIEYLEGKEEYPYLILLDEANLSQMEYYWADFMPLCDLNKANRNIFLTDNMEIKIPNTLKFMATINLDHTTEKLSPRLIDRAWIIMPTPSEFDIDGIEDEQLDEEYKLINFKLLEFAVTNKSLSSAMIDKLSKLLKCFKDEKIYLSPRILNMIKQYCIVGQQYFDNSKNDYTALDYSISQKILPKINGYGKDYKEFIDTLIKECDINTMPICNDILKNIIQKGDKNMGHYSFFVR